MTASFVGSITYHNDSNFVSAPFLELCLYFPLLQELNNPMLYLDIMRWCWQQDFRNRPSAAQLRDVLTNPSIPYLLDAMPLHNTGLVTCACICTLPYEVMPLSDSDSSVEGSLSSSSFSSLPSPHAHVARGDLQEELWLATFCERDKIASIVVLSFKGKAVQVGYWGCLCFWPLFKD